MSNTIDLTKINGCYSKELREFTPTILYMLREPGISVEDMRITVRGIVNRATINAAARQRFIDNLMACATKYDINALCHGAVLHGMYYHPKRKYRNARA